MKNIGILLSGGVGSRFGSNLPKQYTLLNNQEVISYSINAFKKSKILDDFIVVAGESEIQSNVLQDKYHVQTVLGGDTRNKSLMNGLEYIHEHIPDCEFVFVHEAARPFLSAEIVDSYIKYLHEGYDAVITAQKITASLGSEETWVVDRSRYFLIEAPEAFNFKLLWENFDAESTITATVQQLPESIRLMKYYDFPNNHKLTYPSDIEIMESLLQKKEMV